MNLNKIFAALDAVGKVLVNREQVVVLHQATTRQEKEKELRQLILNKGGLSKFNTSYSRMTGDCFRCLWTLEDIQSLSDSKLDIAIDIARVM